VVEAHGGSVRAANAPGGGAIVELVLPEDPAGPPFDWWVDGRHHRDRSASHTGSAGPVA